MTVKELWNSKFEYRDGKLFWRDGSKGGAANLAGKEFGSKCSRKGRRSIYLGSSITVSGKKKTVYVHRIVWEMHNGEIPEGMMIDHIDHNGLNNRIENLRIVSAAGNSKNMPMSVRNKSGISGIHWDKFKDRWRAQIGIKGECKRLGTFDDFFEAVCARKSAEIRHGYHANHGK